MEKLVVPPRSARSNPLPVAVERVSQRLDQYHGSWKSSREEITAALDRIVRAIEHLSSANPSHLEPVGAAHRVLHNRLVEALRAEILQGWHGKPDVLVDGDEQRAVLTLLWQLETYRAQLWPAGRQDLVARLAEPDALELLAEVAHDLRSPLNSILFLSEVLRSAQSGPVSSHQRAQLGLIYGATMGMISVVNDVMELAKDPDGTGNEEPAPFSIGRVFDSIHEVVRPIAEEKGIAIEFSLPDYDHCVGQPGMLGRVVLNLTTNGLKFTERGGVHVGAKRIDRTRMAFAVRDSGRGIPPEAQAQMFQAFQRSSHRDSYFFAQAGLGLSIARRLVGAMGSELSCESEMGRGTVFSFTLDLPPV